MSNVPILLILIVLGFVIVIYFNRRAKKLRERHENQANTIDNWMPGRKDRDDL